MSNCDDDCTESELSEGDWVTADHRTFVQHEAPSAWRKRVIVPEGAEWQDVLGVRMREEGFFPNVWLVSDHGNLIPLTCADVAPMDCAAHLRR